MNLSVVLATYNEEKNLAACLQSVADWCDEIVIVDGTSQDNTVEIAERYKAKVISVPNDPMFHNMKQRAVEEADGDWILQLDADEQISPESKAEILSVIKQANNPNNGYYLPRKNWFLGRYLTKGGVYPDYVIRIFRKGKGHFPAKSVHEQIAVNGKVGYLTQDLIHNADPNIRKYLTRFNRYSSLEAYTLVKAGFVPGFWMFCKYFIWLPKYWFFMRYIRHRGYIDGFQGFVFALLSAMHHPVIYIKVVEKVKSAENL